MQTGALTPENATPGQILAAARNERGMSISEVAQRLKFSLRHIEALEADRYDALPSGPFVRGMIRTYAKLLGVDPARLLEDVPQPEAAGEPAMQPRDMSVPFPQETRPGSRIYLLLSMLIIVAVVVVLAEWFIRSQRNGSEDAALSPPTNEAVSKADSPTSVPLSVETAPTDQQPAAAAEMAPQPAPETAPPAPPIETAPQALQPETAPTVSAASIQEPTAPGATDGMRADAERAPPPASEALPPGSSRLQFTFELESWVEVKDANGDVIFSAINPAGTEKQVVGTPPLSLVIGNASGVRLLYNGEPVALTPHRTSDVARVTLE
jgi:cytoskeleton protein RodZ